jgi:molybdate transport system ATP-binding protein
VTAVERAGTTRLHLRGDLPQGPDLRADVTPPAVAQLGLVAGAQVWASVKATEVTVFETAGTPNDR